MPPPAKAAPKKRQQSISGAPQIMGAKFSWVVAGPTARPIKVMVNLNCPVDIMLDYVKRQLLRKIDDEIATLKALVAQENPEGFETQTLSRPASAPEGQGLDSLALLNKLVDLQGILIFDSVILDFMDPGGINAGAPEVKFNMKNKPIVR